MFKRVLSTLILIAIFVLLVSGCSMRVSKHSHSRDLHRATTVHVQPGRHSHRTHRYFHQGRGRPRHRVEPSKPDKCPQ